MSEPAALIVQACDGNASVFRWMRISGNAEFPEFNLDLAFWNYNGLGDANPSLDAG